MKKILITGGTVFVSRYAAFYFVNRGYDVCVLNRNNHEQVKGVRLIECDRNNIGDKLKGMSFDAVLDINAYTKDHVRLLTEALDQINDYLFISSSAVYPETLPQPFTEDMTCGPNSIWGSYGTNKLEAEKYLCENVPNAYMLRPPYLYGQMETIYRAPFVFDCAVNELPFYLPGDGGEPLQFFHVDDLCRFMELLIEKHPSQHIFNVGNRETVSAKEWVEICYNAAGKIPVFKYVNSDINQNNYFCFPSYAYRLDVSKQFELMEETIPLDTGIREEFNWYKNNQDLLKLKPYFSFIKSNLENHKFSFIIL